MRRAVHPASEASDNLTDAICKLRHVLESACGQPLYAHLYHGDVDTISHYDGPATPSAVADLGLVGYLLQRELVEQLSPQAAQGTLLIITADHGQIYTPLDRAVALRQHPDLWRCLVAPPGGEPRAGYLFVRDGTKQYVQDYIRQQLGHAVEVLDIQDALGAGLWGQAPYHPQLQDRLGDLLLLPRENYWLADPFGETPLFLGWHGGLAPEEMQVPFLMVDLM